jgi:hypothetical protein
MQPEAYLERMQLSAGVRRNLAHLPRDQVLDAATMTSLLAEHVSNAGLRQQKGGAARV